MYGCGKSCITLMPVLVASLTASSSLSYFGLKVTVKAQSIIRPERPIRLVIHNSFYVVIILQKLIEKKRKLINVRELFIRIIM